ncbi:asparagine synthase-related protein [Thermomonas sp.]|uniref:asparagine synthase-related protein n=1 Tax=Thermomonas sp. TaxID=1971895 RepID=UPI002636F674|nr:asparagine synthase-related protein [Thermomonas sp.]MBK9669164.1 hypothetical protein [Thermomonas sp.]MBL0227578.1 hypothetical protein [Thermomonas sp.]
MSGIAGFIQLDAAPVDPARIDAMLATMRRRGPDRRQTWVGANAALGQALLATTPESLAETQPWRHPGSGCVVVSDSRLDNRPQLLHALAIDLPADQVGDAALLHAAWQRWGEGCADRLRGDFAFAIWDPRKQALFCARDPMGVRPFAYHLQPDRLFVFASSAKTVVAQGNVPNDLDQARVADALFGETEGVDATATFYRSVSRLPPAHWLRVAGGRLTISRYWQPLHDRPGWLPTHEADWIEAQREQLDRAVRRRLRSHRPVGSMLSGGLDSSSVVVLAAAACGARGLPAFPVYSAIDSSDSHCAETRSIRTVIAGVRCAPTAVDLTAFAAAPSAEQAWWQLCEEPFDGTLNLAATLYRAAASGGGASLMDGVPADNLYVTGEYAKHLARQGRWGEAWQAAVTQWTLPGKNHPRLHALWTMAGTLAPGSVHAIRDFVADTRSYRALLRESLLDRDHARATGFWPRYRRYRRTIGGSHQWHPTDEALSSITAPFITAALERYNRVASLFGVEPRPPYADRDLVEFQAWMPLALRTRDGHRKWVLRQAMSGLLPPSVAWRQDKSHLGRRFAHATFEHARKAGLLPNPPGPEPWMRRPDMAGPEHSHPAHVSEAMLRAIRLHCWLHERATGGLPV